MDTHERYERIALLEEAQGLLEKALSLVREAVWGTGLYNRAEAYIVPTLRMAISDDHNYLGGQPSNLAEMIDSLHEEEGEH